jgi:SET domain-containing protein
MIRKRKIIAESENNIGDSQNNSCYCGELLSNNCEATIQCHSCHGVYHSSCIKLIRGWKILYGDLFYEYQCGKCVVSEKFVRLPISW